MNAAKAGFSERLWNLLFPARCVMCGERVAPGEILCGNCLKKLPDKPYIRRYAVPGSGERGFLTMAPLSYHGGARETIHRFKFRGKRALAQPLGRLMAGVVPEPRRFDGVTWAPLGAHGKRKRGYDQSELLAKAVAEALGLPLIPLLTKSRETKTQHELSREERLKNVKGAYRAVGTVKKNSLILVDDIVTTGATLRECAGVLYRAGAKEILGLCAADAPADRLKGR